MQFPPQHLDDFDSAINWLESGRDRIKMCSNALTHNWKPLEMGTETEYVRALEKLNAASGFVRMAQLRLRELINS